VLKIIVRKEIDIHKNNCNLVKLRPIIENLSNKININNHNNLPNTIINNNNTSTSPISDNENINNIELLNDEIKNLNNKFQNLNNKVQQIIQEISIEKQNKQERKRNIKIFNYLQSIPPKDKNYTALMIKSKNELLEMCDEMFIYGVLSKNKPEITNRIKEIEEWSEGNDTFFFIVRK
jgi:hypothetical protein